MSSCPRSISLHYTNSGPSQCRDEPFGLTARGRVHVGNFGNMFRTIHGLRANALDTGDLEIMRLAKGVERADGTSTDRS